MLAYTSLQVGDVQTITGIILVTALLIMLINLITDVLYSLVELVGISSPLKSKKLPFVNRRPSRSPADRKRGAVLALERNGNTVRACNAVIDSDTRTKGALLARKARHFQSGIICAE